MNILIGRIRKSPVVLLLAAVLLIQALVLVYIADKREGLHIDEIYSYILSNSYDTDRISNAPDFWDRWLDGSEFREFLMVARGEQFAYQTVYENNAKDAHPPMFYFILHTVCSLFPGCYSPWIGMGINIVLIILAQLVLFHLGKKLMGNSLWAVVPVAIYGGMQLFVDTTLFIRMYALMTLLTVLLVEQHYRLLTTERKCSSILWCYVLTFLGVFTQYYFAVTAFFLAAGTCIFLMIHKQWKWLVAYGAAMLFAVMSVFLVFPAGISQITGSETNNIGVEVASNILNFSGWGAAIRSMLWQATKGMFAGIRSCWFIVVPLTVVTVAVSIRFRLAGVDESYVANKKQCVYFGVALTVIVAFSIAAISHISGKFTYVRYLNNLFPIVALVCGIVVWFISGVLKLNRMILALGVIAVWLISTCTMAKYTLCSYMFTERTARDNIVMEQCQDKPMIVLNNGTTHQPTALIHILLSSDQVFMANFNDMDRMDSVLGQVDCSNGVVYLVLTDVYWSEGFDGEVLMNEVVEQSEILGSYSKLEECDFTTAYVALPEA